MISECREDAQRRALAISEPETLEISLADRLCLERIKRFAKHLADTGLGRHERGGGLQRGASGDAGCRPRLVQGYEDAPHAAVPPRSESRPAITSLQLLKLGQEPMDPVPPKLGTKLRLADAVQYRDGLMIALIAFAPVRRKNPAALDFIRYLHLGEGTHTVLIPSAETKTGTSIDFGIPPFLLPHLCECRESVRPRIHSDTGGTALWVSPKGGALSHAAIGGILARHCARRLGLHLSPHDVRVAAATTWGVFSPEQIDVAQELLAHKDIRTTTAYYNRARGIQASRKPDPAPEPPALHSRNQISR